MNEVQKQKTANKTKDILVVRKKGRQNVGGRFNCRKRKEIEREAQKRKIAVIKETADLVEKIKTKSKKKDMVLEIEEKETCKDLARKLI